MNPKYPVYIPTKGRWEAPWTIRSFEAIGVPFKAVVEPQEYDKYAAAIGEDKLLVLPHTDKGLVVTRNWIWEHALQSGTKRFWTFDDNIGTGVKNSPNGVYGLFRLNHNLKVPCRTGAPLRAIEDFVERYENVPIAGMHYFMFARRKSVVPPFYLNTRVYSNMLIETDLRDSAGRPVRNEGFYNDDTDLCLRVLKDGMCTILFNAFLVRKRTTMTGKGGMTGYYQGDGRYKMAKELADKHPDVARVTRKWGRWQHHVDYRKFKRNRLRRKAGTVAPTGIDNYGMRLEVRQ